MTAWIGRTNHDVVRPFVHGGGAYFEADSGNTAVLREGTVERDRQSVAQTNSGWGPYFSAGVDIFATPWVGVRTGVVYEQLKDDSVGESEGDVEEDLLKFILNVVLSF